MYNPWLPSLDIFEDRAGSVAEGGEQELLTMEATCKD